MIIEKHRGLGWLAPTPRLIVFAVLSMLITFSNSWETVLVSLVVSVSLLALGGKVPRAAFGAAVSALVLTMLGHALTAQDPEAYSFLIFRISEISVLKGLRLGLRLFAMILPAIAFIAVTPIYELLEAFRGLRIPPAADMYLTIVLRYVDILWYDIQISMKAMAVRGVNWEGSIRDKIPAFRRLMLPLIFRILDHVDGQSLAIDNRGGVRAVREDPRVDPDRAAVAMQRVYVRYDAPDDPDGDHALSDVTLEIEPGEASVLLGRTGAGKTTALLLCTGLIPKSVGRMKGDVELFGYNTKTASLSTLGRLARIVFPSAVQGLVGLTVQGELAFSLRSSTVDEEERRRAVARALEVVGLDESFLERPTLGLSGGEMQRVALASAIVAQPHLLALDDVTVQLDPVGKREVVAALQSLLGGRITTVMTDPYVDLLEEVGTRFVMLESGRIVGERRNLTAEAIQTAGLRVPQILRLGQALNLSLPARVDEALPILRDFQTTPPENAPVERLPLALPLVQAAGLTFAYPDGPTAVKGVDVAFHEGEFVAVLGSNGSGKTTLALMLAGALTPSGGTVSIDGEPFNAARHRGRIGYVFQEPVNQVVTMKVSDELAFGPEQLGWSPEEIQAAVDRELARFDLPPAAVPLHLSPAEARKLAIAATLAMKPRMVILDEPTNNLDEEETRRLIERLQELRREGTVVVVITHDVEIACEHADRLVVLSGGKVLLDGPAREVMAQPEVLRSSDVTPPPVVALSLGLWPDRPPAMSVEELAGWLSAPVAQPGELQTGE